MKTLWRPPKLQTQSIKLCEKVWVSGFDTRLAGKVLCPCGKWVFCVTFWEERRPPWPSPCRSFSAAPAKWSGSLWLAWRRDLLSVWWQFLSHWTVCVSSRRTKSPHDHCGRRYHSGLGKQTISKRTCNTAHRMGWGRSTWISARQGLRRVSWWTFPAQRTNLAFGLWSLLSCEENPGRFETHTSVFVRKKCREADAAVL